MSFLEFLAQPQLIPMLLLVLWYEGRMTRRELHSHIAVHHGKAQK